MKKPTFSKILLIAISLLIYGLDAYAQNLVPFSPRYDRAIKGDMLLIGNSNVGIHVSDPYNGSNTNDNLNAAVYVDIDGDPSTFNSSSADLDVPSDLDCYQIVYAGLYWSAVVNGSEPISDVKFKVPGGSYVDITGTEIYYQNAANNFFSNTYAYYHDVTDMLAALPDPEGTYAVANISTLVGPKPNSEGLSAGWSLFVVYEDPTLPSKYITSFDGFTKITSSINETFPVSGFNTIPTGPVRAKFAFSTIEGDRGYSGDYLRLNGTTISATNNAGNLIRPGNNFFNSSVSDINPATNTSELFTARNPTSSNTLGFDAGIINIPNPGNTLIANNATSANISLGSNLDIYYYYFSAFAIEIIAPNIVLTKIVEDNLGNNIGGDFVDLGDPVNYVIGFQNTGNDNATNFQIRDILPINIIYNHPTDLVLPSGVTVASYDPATRELIFDIDNSLVEQDDPVYEIRINARIVDECNQLADACSNIITNQAFATYQGTINPNFTITDDPSVNSNTGCLLTPQATNFLANLDCTFEQSEILCGTSLDLTAANGYDSYSWSTSPTGTPVIGTSQSITVTESGTYYVYNTAIAPCQSITQQFNVQLFGNGVDNPVIPYADEVVICPNDGKELPNIFLCGANDSRLIETNISNSTSIIWEKLDESSCPAVSNTDCANEDASCTWVEVDNDSSFLANDAGQYRLTINYPGGCFVQFYFNVYQNVLNATVDSTDIICSTPGGIIVNDLPSGYEYSIDNNSFQTSNEFTITTPGTYTIYVRQTDADINPCVFTIPDVIIRDRDFTVTNEVSQPLCHGDKGSIQLAANDVDPQYTFTLSQSGTLVNTVGPTIDNTYAFNNLNPGTYTATVETENGCLFSEDVTIVEPPLLRVTAALTTPLACDDGIITIYPVGGTPPYYYFINSLTDFQSTPEVTVTAPGTYDIMVLDSNNCSATTSITVGEILEPDFNISSTDILCTDAGDTGSITINVTNANGNSVQYSIDGGSNFFSSNVFTNLAQGNYDVVLQYSSGTTVCTSTPQTVTINANPSLTGTAELTTPYSCTTNGTITVTGVTGGNGSYEYSIDGVNFQISNIFSNLTQGTYEISVKDDSGCILITNEIVIEPLNPITDIEIENTPIACPSYTTTVTITSVTGGTGAIEYQIIAPAAAATAYQASNVFSGLEAGTYTFQVRDENDCTYSESYTIDPIAVPTIDAVLTNDLNCTASPDAAITGTITGTSPFTYAVSFNGGAYTDLGSTGSPYNYTTSNDGTYQFQVTDANGCTAESNIITVNPLSLPAISTVVQTQEILCNDDANGAIDITIDTTTGTPPFIINVNNDTTGTDYGTQTSGLPAGTYTITVTDAKECTATETIVINEPDAITFDLSKVDITCNNPGGSSLGSITVENVTGGTAPFTYFISNNFGNVIPGNPYSATSNEDHTFNIIDFGAYTVNVVDANGCSLSQQIVIASPPSDLDISITTSTPDCASGGTIEVTAISAVGSGSYEFGILEFNAIPYTSTYLAPDVVGGSTRTFTNLIPGVLYTFVVHDLVTDCYYVKSADTPINAASTLTSTVVPNNVVCLGENNGSVTFTIDNFDSTTNSVDYSIHQAFTNTLISGPTNLPVTFGTPETVTTPNPGTLSPGQYYIVFTENGSGSFNGCMSASAIFEITESPVALELSTSVDQNANCNPNSGLISAIGQNGTAPYRYQMTTTATAPLATDTSWSSASTFNADAGNYYVHVIDANGCIVTSPVVVLPNDDSPVISASVDDACVLEGNYEINVALDVASAPPYSVSINGGAFQVQTFPFTINNLNSGTHTIEVNDINGCGNLVSINIEEPIVVSAETTVEPTCNDDDGEITVTASGGSGSYSYSITPNPSSISLAANVFSGVPNGNYTVTITDTVTLCTEDVSVFVPEATPPLFTLTPTSVTCFGDNTGSFDINITNYTGAYTYEVYNNLGVSVTGVVNANTSTNPQTVNGMGSGTHLVVITELSSPFCSSVLNVVISSPAEDLSLNLSETSSVTCDNINGTITAIASGGWGNYEYELTGDATVAYSSNNMFANLSSGNYTVNVRDEKGCITTENITLDDPAPIAATFTPNVSTLACFGDQNGSITVTNVTGGQGTNYTYTLNTILPTPSSSGPQTSNVFENLAAGTYTITITDGFNCEFTSLDIVINDPTPIEVNLVRASTQTCLVESTLTLSATGGTGPYTYSNDINFGTVLGSFATSTTISVPEGTYSYYVRDANNCITSVSNEITVEPLPPLTINLESINPIINCAGDNNGSVVATAQGGLGTYVYTLQDDLGNTVSATQSAPGYFTELYAGDYVVLVESGDCSETSAPIRITEPSQPLEATFVVSNVTCTGNDNGSLEINASGGTGIIKYAISPQLNQFFETNLFENLAPGNYDVIVQDELGCYITHNFTITEPAPVIISIVANSIFPEVCEGDANGEFSIDISGGNLPYSVSLDDYNGIYTTGLATQTQFDFTNLEGGDHIVYIRDAEGCESEWNITFPETITFDPELVIESICENNIQNTVVTVNVETSTTDLSELDYSLNDGPYQESNVFTNIPVGTGHYINVRHTNGCIKTTELFNIEAYNPMTVNLTDGVLNEYIINVSGGSGDYQFTINGEDYGQENTFFITESGEYTIIVTDSSGCTATLTIELEFIDLCIPNYFTPNNDGVTDTWAPGCAENYPNLTFDIFDRYGRKVAEYNVGEVWDGKYNGKELPTGDYWFVVKTNDSNVDKEFVGHFTLYR